jgi:hypothetical protein
MIENDFYNWVSDSYDDGTLSLDEMQKVMKSKPRAFQLWVDYIDNNDLTVCEMVQNQVMDFLIGEFGDYRKAKK